SGSSDWSRWRLAAIAAQGVQNRGALLLWLAGPRYHTELPGRMPDNAQEFLQHYPWVYSILGLVLLTLAALFANTVVKSLLLRVLHRILDRTAYGRDEEVRRHGLIERLAN